jgi:hypothetical protein
VHDKRKIQAVVFEIEGSNDNLEGLFQDATSRSALLIKSGIDQSEVVQTLQLLQEATADGHKETSETASMGLEALGATASVRSTIPDVVRTLTEEQDAASPLRPMSMRSALGLMLKWMSCPRN